MEDEDGAKGHEDVEGTNEGDGEDAQRPDAQNRVEGSGDGSSGEDANSPAEQNQVTSQHAGQGQTDELGSTSAAPAAAPAANDDVGHTVTRTDDDQDGDAKSSNLALETPRTRYKNFLGEHKRKRLKMKSRNPVNLSRCDSVGTQDIAKTTSDGEETRQRDGTAMTYNELPEPVKTGHLRDELFNAIEKGDSKEVQELLNAGADPNSRDAVIRRRG
jgi:hypothetical protein